VAAIETRRDTRIPRGRRPLPSWQRIPYAERMEARERLEQAGGLPGGVHPAERDD